jgi:hypothetical protein
VRGPLVDARSMVQMVARQLAYVFRGGIRVQRAQADTACVVARIQDAFLPQGMGGIGQQHPNFSISCKNNGMNFNELLFLFILFLLYHKSKYDL